MSTRARTLGQILNLHCLRTGVANVECRSCPAIDYIDLKASALVECTSTIMRSTEYKACEVNRQLPLRFYRCNHHSWRPKWSHNSGILAMRLPRINVTQQVPNNKTIIVLKRNITLTVSIWPVEMMGFEWAKPVITHLLVSLLNI